MPKVEYNRELDILIVEEDDYEDYGESQELGGFVLDLDSDSEFLGLEIIDASQKTPLTREELQDIQEAEVELEKQEDYIRINVTVTLNTGKSVISSQYPRTATA
ncbi:MAG: hypothetical protein ABEK16_00400 [Candidatus Nanohalobium sp.]